MAIKNKWAGKNRYDINYRTKQGDRTAAIVYGDTIESAKGKVRKAGYTLLKGSRKIRK